MRHSLGRIAQRIDISPDPEDMVPIIFACRLLDHLKAYFYVQRINLHFIDDSHQTSWNLYLRKVNRKLH
jgi:hypothetical protein